MADDGVSRIQFGRRAFFLGAVQVGAGVALAGDAAVEPAPLELPAPE